MTPIDEDDLDWLTRVENRLITMRKRETQHREGSMLVTDLTDAIKEVHGLRNTLQARFGKQIDER